MNKLYGMLVDSPDSAEFYYRNTKQVVSRDPAAILLIPQSADKAYRQYCADQICRLCHAAFPTELAELDPQNSYAYPAAVVTTKVTDVSGLPAGITSVVFDAQVAYTFVNKTFSFVYDGVGTLSFEGKAVPWSNGTGVFEYGGFRIAITGVAAGAFQGTMAMTRVPDRSLLKLDERIKDYAETMWDPTFEPYRDATLITKRIAAFALNVLKRVG